MRKLLVSATAVLAVAAFSTPALAAKIVLNDVGGVESGSQAYKGFSIASKFWEQRLTNDVTINLDVGFRRLGDRILGQTLSSSTVAPMRDSMAVSAGVSKVWL